MEPSEYFENQIKILQKQLNISSDLAFVLLKKYHWDVNEASQKWISSPVEVAKSLNISIENNDIPSNCSLLSKESNEEEECPLCMDEVPLIQLYCGHKNCPNCFILGINSFINNENKISWPCCLDLNQENNQICNSFYIPSDISKYIKDDQILSQLKQNFLQKEIFNLKKVRLCQNCKILITEENGIGYGIAECPKCKAKYCLNCLYQGCHAPLFCEEKLNEFKIEKKDELHLLFYEQKKWIEREKRLKEYRKSHQDEVISYFDNKIEKCIENNRKIEKEELSKISEISNKIESLKHQQQSTSPNDQIAFEIKCYEKVKDEFDSTHSKNCEERSNVLKKWNELKELFESSVNNESDYPSKVQQMIDASIKNCQINFSDVDDYMSNLKQCPHCYTLFLRPDGCFQYFCHNCCHEFCWICLGDWNKDHFCTHLSIARDETRISVINGINYDDDEDKKFHPIPFDFDKQIEFGRWIHLYKELQKNIDALESLKKAFLSNINENDVKFRIVQMLSNENDKMDENESKATGILNDILFVKSVIAWSYPAMFYCNNDVDRKVLEAKAEGLNDEVNDFIDSIKGQKIDKPNEYFTRRIQKLNDFIKSIYDTVKSF